MKATCVALSVCIGAATMPMFCCCKVREGERGRAEYTIDAEYEEETGTLRGVLRRKIVCENERFIRRRRGIRNRRRGRKFADGAFERAAVRRRQR